MVSRITKTDHQDDHMRVCYDDGSEAKFDNSGRLLEWVGVASFRTLALTPGQAREAYKLFLLFWETHADPMCRPLEMHHAIPLFCLKEELGESTTDTIRGGIMDRGKQVGLPAQAHMRAHALLMVMNSGTPAFDDARAAFEMLTGRLGPSISDSAKVELYDMKQLAKKLSGGPNPVSSIKEYRYTKFTGKDFSGKELTGTGFHGCIFDGCDFSGAVLDMCDLTFTIFRNCTMENCRMNGTDTRGMRIV